MSTIQQSKFSGRSISLFLKKDSDFSQDTTLSLVKGISDQQEFTLDGKVVDVSDFSLDQLIQTKTQGVSGWHRFSDAFDQCFTSDHDDSKFSGEVGIIEALEEAFERGQDGGVWTDCADRPIRSVSVGDVFSVHEWRKTDGQSGSPRHFVVTKVGFQEFKRATGELV